MQGSLGLARFYVALDLQTAHHGLIVVNFHPQTTSLEVALDLYASTLRLVVVKHSTRFDPSLDFQLRKAIW
jgi:hypothetical protein